MILKDIIKKFDKSNIKAGDGLDKGNYPLYTCSPVVNKFLNDYLYDDEAIIISTGGNFAAHYVKGRFNYSTDCYVFNTDKYNLKYLYYFLLSKNEDINKMFRGAGLKHLNKNEFVMLNIKEIPLNEQDRIVNQLDKINEMIKVRKKEIDKCNNLIKSQFVEMFVNKEYSKITVEDVCEKMKIGPFGSALHKNEISTSGDVFVLGTDNAVDNEFKVYEQRFITTEKFKELEKYKVAAGDIIISMMGTIGRTSVIPVDFYPSIISSHLCMLTSYPNKMDPYFLNCILILDDNISHQININKKGAIMSGLNLGIIKKLQIPNVPIEEQKKFLNIKNQIDKQKFVM